MRTATGKGVSLSIVSAFCGAANLIFYKAAGADGASRQAVVLAALGWAAVFNTAMAMGWRRPVVPRDRLSILAALLLGVLTLLANLTVIQALATLEPALTSVMAHTQVLFVTIIGWVILREHVTVRFGVGIVFALVGIAVMRLVDAPPAPAAVTAAARTAADVSAAGIGWALAASITWAFMQVFTRKVIHRIDPVSVNTLRLWSAAAMVAWVPGTAQACADLDLEIWLLAAGAAFSGPFLARTCLMYAVRHIPASHSTALTLVAPVFAFILGFLVFGTMPSRIEMIGGIIVLAGVALPLADITRPPPVSPST